MALVFNIVDEEIERRMYHNAQKEYNTYMKELMEKENRSNLYFISTPLHDNNYLNFYPSRNPWSPFIDTGDHL